MNTQEVAEPNTVLRGLVGSTVHGLHLEGSDDRDEMGVCIEPPEYVVGLQRFEQWTYRTQPEGKRSGPGDLDLTVYSLRKWVRLAANGNPTVLLLLFVPEEHLVVNTPIGRVMRMTLPGLLASKRAGAAFLGYLTQQKERLLGTRGQLRVTRTELVERYGFDTKYAMHMLRLGYQGVEYLTTGQLSLPMREPERSLVMSVRRGDVPLGDVLTSVAELEASLRGLQQTAELPDEPNREMLDSFLTQTYLNYWR